ncbi:hypothetical protein CHS0354_019698 [Potamilus streckersoni]|uniref:Uncharacterized protein n=1 Tax=Potamilus streckersoni TaxID=2493646 RepID=A0AAE0SAJ2_9BIVA|nr:hypothetical protein CHS0354_019698 [Potamilus streckersoni]
MFCGGLIIIIFASISVVASHSNISRVLPILKVITTNTCLHIRGGLKTSNISKMTRICLFLICLAVYTYTTYAFVGFENGDLMMLQMMTGMFGGQRGANPSQAPGGGADLGIQGQPSNTRRADDFGLGSLMQMRLMSALMN